MEPSLSCVPGYFVSFLLLQMVLTSEQFTVHSSRSRHVVLVGEHTELSCQLSPPQSAEHMQVGWYRDHYQPISIYKKEKKHSGKSTQNYTNHTVLLKDALGEGKMTLRIHNASVIDEGKYHCFFKDGDISEEAVMDLKVAALGLDIQINVQVPDTEGLMVECNSGGWYPQPQMNWRDSRENVIPASSKIFSEDGDGLLHLKTSVLLKNSTHGPITCCFHNPVTGQEKRASIVLPGIQANWFIYWGIVFNCLPFLMHASIFPVYWYLRDKASVLDAQAPFYSTWMCDMSWILGILMAFFTLLIFGLLYTLKDISQEWISDCSSETQDT
ncbi:putative selection and upkeep of intraepithelial T-cells protein 1 homolog isoform X2 [Eptesicus fuscus]|uniref:putative selection and upkeep of intraepithelial T-cells protein 1 homolog isoform X2 n=1 Tax=Eptesicus fuscus TaxID=29078 RepID=UPI0024046F42|nr:putative selection and upkeep of intraepithelial T-cells protein 1 homolog isoform X2 [Eptesicus fuscus]